VDKMEKVDLVFRSGKGRCCAPLKIADGVSCKVHRSGSVLPEVSNLD
jgi:hypothetical protein